jgi:hypothetical protein
MMVDLNKLKYAVGHSPYSWHQLCVKAKLTRASYRYWRGERAFPLEVGLLIALHLNIDVREILTDDGKWLLKNSMHRKDNVA